MKNSSHMASLPLHFDVSEIIYTKREIIKALVVSVSVTALSV